MSLAELTNRIDFLIEGETMQLPYYSQSSDSTSSSVVLTVSPMTTSIRMLD